VEITRYDSHTHIQCGLISQDKIMTKAHVALLIAKLDTSLGFGR